MDFRDDATDVASEDFDDLSIVLQLGDNYILDEEQRVDGLKVFRRHARRYRLLDAEQERSLAWLIAQGEDVADSARATFVLSNLRLADSIAGEFLGRGFGRLDLIREAVLALRSAVDGFDPTSGNRFSSYACPAMRNYLKGYVGRKAERNAEDAKYRAFGDSGLVPAAEMGLDDGRLDVVGSDGCHLSKPKLQQPSLGGGFFDEGEDRKQAERGNGMDVRPLREVGVGGLKRRVTVVGSEDEVRARFREARLKGVVQPVSECEICGKSVRLRDEYAAMRWWREHACEEIVRDWRGRSIPLEDFDPNEARRRRFFLQQAAIKERRRVIKIVDRLERVREESRWFEGLAEKGKHAQREAMSRGGKKAT